MNMMFRDCKNFNQPLNSWKTFSLKDTSLMFKNTTKFDQEINNRKMNNVNNIYGMFSESIFNQNINKIC